MLSVHQDALKQKTLKSDALKREKSQTKTTTT